MRQVFKPAAILLLTAVLATALLSFVHEFTREPISAQAERTRAAMRREVLPGAVLFTERPDPPDGMTSVHIGLDDAGRTVGCVLGLFTTEGYGGRIDVMVGISSAGGQIAGMRVLKHSETPGLGALAVKETFFRQFDGKPLTPLTVVKSAPGGDEIDAITSATITSNAVTGAVNRAVAWYNANMGGDGA